MGIMPIKRSVVLGKKTTILKKMFIAGLVLALFGVSTVAGVFYFFSRDLPKLDRLSDYKPKLKTKVFSSDDKLIGEFYVENREMADMDEVPQSMINAIIAAEDKSFFRHSGIDFVGILRAAIANFLAGDIKQGASTITQQVAKTFLLSSERKYKRKIKEAILASRIEDKFTKREILHLYLNQIFFGHNSYGIKVAARNYFDKDVRDLNIAECALLAGLPKAPSANSPFVRPKRARERQRYVLRRMKEDRFINEDQYNQALDYTLNLKEYVNSSKTVAPYFTEYIRRYLKSKYGDDAVYEGGMTVYATVDTRLQKAAQAAIKKGVLDLDKRQGYRGVRRELEPEEINEFILATKDDKKLEELELGKVYKDFAVVTMVDDKTDSIHIQLGKHLGVIEMEKLNVQEPNPGAIPPYKVVIKKPHEVFNLGNVIDVTVTDVKIEDLEKGTKTYKFSLYQEPLAQAAIMSMDVRTGFVRAMVGGYDFAKSEFNRAVQAHRLPGSAFKPVVYAAALDKKPKKNGKYYTPATLLYDTARVFEDGYKPSNYGNKFKGAIPLRIALNKSINAVAVKVISDIGTDYVQEYAKKLRIDSKINPDPTAALGSSTMTLSELTSVYGIFASGGLKVEPVFVVKVLDRDGEVLEEYIPPNEREEEPLEDDVSAREDALLDELALEGEEPVAKEEVEGLEGTEEEITDDPQRVMDPATAYVMTSLLTSVVQAGTGWRLKKEFGKLPLAGKTGTTNNCIDAWFMGFSPEIVTGVWVGIDEKMSLGRVETGSRAAAPIWVDYMREALKGRPVQNFPIPDGVEFAKIDPKTGLLAREDTKDAVFECFKKGTVPTEYTSQPEELFSIDSEDTGIHLEYPGDIDGNGADVVIKTDGEDDETIPIAIP